MCNKVTSDVGPKCPYCGHVRCDDLEGVVSYWGSQGHPVDFVCSACDLTFTVNEIVARSWESTPIAQEAAKSE